MALFYIAGIFLGFFLISVINILSSKIGSKNNSKMKRGPKSVVKLQIDEKSKDIYLYLTFFRRIVWRAIEEVPLCGVDLWKIRTVKRRA
jgi:hypothetical protein